MRRILRLPFSRARAWPDTDRVSSAHSAEIDLRCCTFRGKGGYRRPAQRSCVRSRSSRALRWRACAGNCSRVARHDFMVQGPAAIDHRKERQQNQVRPALLATKSCNCTNMRTDSGVGSSGTTMASAARSTFSDRSEMPGAQSRNSDSVDFPQRSAHLEKPLGGMSFAPQDARRNFDRRNPPAKDPSPISGREDQFRQVTFAVEQFLWTRRVREGSPLNV